MSTICEEISEHDKALSLLRESWMEAEVTKKPRWMELINQALDKRLELMRRRDSQLAPTTP